MIGRRPLLAGMGALFAASAWPRAAAGEEPPIATTYAALGAYSDSGTVEIIREGVVRERHGFETAFRAPRTFLFRFLEDRAAGGDEFALWCDGGDLQSWWKAARSYRVHEAGRWDRGFALGAGPTRGAAGLVAPLLFPEEGVAGPALRRASLSRDARTGLIRRLALERPGAGDAPEIVVYRLDPVANPRGIRPA